MNTLKTYFSELSISQLKQYEALLPIYTEWNQKINVISRKDIDNFYERHIIHSLSIAKIFKFRQNCQILDIGTGGGFPGIPLAIYFPNCHFHLVDSIGKKVTVVNEVIKELNLKNVSTQHGRVEQCTTKFDYAVTRAVAPAKELIQWSSKIVNKRNGIIALKGGDLSDELSEIKCQYDIYPIQTLFKETFFETKQIVHLYNW